LERDLELAAKVQQELFPSAVPALPTMDIAAHSKPARVVGGDYYDFFSFRDGSQGIVIADVMGKGLSASMLMSNVQASLRILGPQFDEPCDLALRLNELFRFNVAMSRFISLFIVAVDADENRIRYVNAGHNPGLVLRAQLGQIEELRPTGPAIGLTREPPMEAGEVSLGEGDLLVLYTDGLVESRNGNGIEYGVERLKAFLAENHEYGAEQFSARLWRDFEAFTGGRRIDDVTTVVLKSTS
jgi:sigma-B regulation protein RsbU (phosphoserine phosphatase)